MFLKNKAFKCEKEYRLLLTNINNGLKLVEIVGDKPRIEVKFKDSTNIRDFIKEIKVSPHGNIEQNKLLAQILIERYNPKKNIEISMSKIPYRLI